MRATLSKFAPTEKEFGAPAIDALRPRDLTSISGSFEEEINGISLIGGGNMSDGVGIRCDSFYVGQIYGKFGQQNIFIEGGAV